MKIESRSNQLLAVDYPLIQSCDSCIASPESIAMLADAGVLPFVIVVEEDTQLSINEKITKIKLLTSNHFGIKLVLKKSKNYNVYCEIVTVIKKNKVSVLETDIESLSILNELVDDKSIQIFCRCYSLIDAKLAQSKGCDGVIMMGGESIGGRDSISSLLLIPHCVENLNIPIIACGGFDSGKGLAAAFSLGAQAVAMERCLVSCNDAQIIINDIVIQACKVVNFHLAPLK